MKWLSIYAPLPEFQISEKTFYLLPVKILSQGQRRTSFSVNKWFYAHPSPPPPPTNYFRPRQATGSSSIRI